MILAAVGTGALGVQPRSRQVTKYRGDYPDRTINLNFSRPLQLGSERARVRFYQFDTMPGVEPVEAGQQIGVSYLGRIQLIRELNQLRGLLRITDGNEALRVVRLRTSPGTWHMWPDGPSEVEIVAASRARSLPNFGLPGFGQWLVAHWTKSSSGLDGILSDEVYGAIGFGPPKVRRATGEFVIERWIYAEEGIQRRRSIQKLRESVGENGEYRRAVVASIDPRRVNQLRIGWYE